MEEVDWSTILQAATILSLTTPLLLALGKYLKSRREQPVADAQVVQGMTMTFASGLQEHIRSQDETIARKDQRIRTLEQENVTLDEMIDLMRAILRVNDIEPPKTPAENRETPEQTEYGNVKQP